MVWYKSIATARGGTGGRVRTAQALFTVPAASRQASAADVTS